MQLAAQQHQAGRLAEADSLYQKVLERNPNHPDALHMRGVLAAQSGNLKTAIDLIQRAITANPASAAYFNDLGIALRLSGRFSDAIAAHRQALCLKPDFAQALNNLGNALSDTGQLDAAIESFQRVLQLKPLSETYNNLGIALRRVGRLDEAVIAHRQALRIKPNYAEANNSLGQTLHANHQFNEAITAYRVALKIRPLDPSIHNNLGVALCENGELDEALAAYREALRLNKDFFDAHNNLGIALRSKGHLDEAAQAHQRALELRPDDARTKNNLANALWDGGFVDAATTCYRGAVALDPGAADIHGNLIYSLHFHPDYDAGAILDEQRIWNQRHAAPLARQIQPPGNDPNPDRRLRIGYVSPDFFQQAESHFVLPLLRSHDRSAFEIHCYASVTRPDSTTALIRDAAEVWHDVLGLSDELLAQKIQNDRMDILVDLTMHMAQNRLLVFARKPAPVQATWLAYPGGTGMTAMDYRLTDAYMDPPGESDTYYVEKSVRLPDCWCCYDPITDLPPSGEPPVATAGYITFASLNNFCKINPPVLHLWSKLLSSVPQSRILLLAGEGDHRRSTAAIFEEQGIAPHRVEFASRCPRAQYLRLYQGIDIALDPFPYNGITTTCDALLMGVPVVTFPGDFAPARVGYGLLTTAGLQELVASSRDEWVKLAGNLAGDLPRLMRLRRSIPLQLRQSPLMNAPRFAHNMESAYRQMWQTWCAGRK
jgi:predicted O-linked N-acetylglucosamine transferase (SPINDLY family)